jgi:molybdopterin-guanine dinucleotide biosynthesis protein B
LPKDIPVVLVIGKQNVGKTTLICLIIPILKKKGYRVGTIKYNIPSFEIDYEGKDTYKYYRAGANAVAISSPEKIAIIKKVGQKSPSIKDIIRDNYKDTDIVLVEGYKKWRYPYIEISGYQRHPKTSGRKYKNHIHIMSDEKAGSGPPLFNKNTLFDTIKFIESKIKK